MDLAQLRFPAVPEELERRYRSEGLWTDESLGEVLFASLSSNPQTEVRIWSHTHPYRGTLGTLLDLGSRIAGGLAARGIRPGDRVCFQLPNWAESAAAFVGLTMSGAVLVPVVHFYGTKELRFILRDTGAKALVTVDRFGSRNYAEELEEIRADLPDLEHVFVIGETRPSWATPFSDLLEGAAVDGPARLDSASPAVIAYTSGTSADSKGVVIPHRALVANARHHMNATFPRGRPQLMGSPISHVSGMMAGLLLPAYRGTAIHLTDVWDPEMVLDAILEADVTSGSGAPIFMTSLIDHPRFTAEHLAKITHGGFGGTSIPVAFMERLDAMGIRAQRSYGCTEHIALSGCLPDDPRDKRLYTDGRPLAGTEARTIDEEGHDVGPGEPGELLTRGPSRFLGYTNPELTAEAVDSDWWYHTGDIAIIDPEGYLTITDRMKDIIIRGGVNISALEVEQLLVRMPGVAEVAVVAAPDERMGEHACAFFRLNPGAELPDRDAVRAHLDAAGLARPKWPEELRVIDDFPRTPAGKIKKFVLRDAIRAEAGAEK